MDHTTGLRCAWVVQRGIDGPPGPGASTWEESWWEKADWARFHETGASKHGKEGFSGKVRAHT